jgi:sugar (pentulose or hexulose) kinase
MGTAGATELLLAIDCGTQSVRALLFDLHGNLVGHGRETLDDYFSPQDRWLEHDAEAFWERAAAACRALWIERGEERGRVRGIVVTSQRGTLVPVDRAGQALRPFIVWLDQRRASEPRRFPPWWRAIFAVAGVSDTVDYLTREAECNWIAEHEPQVWERTHKVLLLSGWLNYRLTGRFADSAASQVGYLPFDFRRHRWARAWDWQWHALPLRLEQLPDLVEVGDVIGPLQPAAAERIGLPAGLPVIAAAADKACEILGAGAISADVGALSYGTAATIDVTTARYLEVTPFLPPYPAAVRGQYNCEVQIFRGYWMVNWFKEQFGHPESSAAALEGIAPELLFERLVDAVPPGSQGLLLQPYWSPGLRNPGPDARGAIIGFSDVHTRAHLYRAILEGLAYALREGKERIERKTGAPVRQLRVSGGGSQSDSAMQLTADIFGLPAARPHTFETAGLGACMAGAIGLGLYRDAQSAVAGMTRQGRVFEPAPANEALYDELYRKVYRRLYGRVGPLYKSLQRILNKDQAD